MVQFVDAKLKLAALEPQDFDHKVNIRQKYFFNNNRSLDRFHIPEMGKELYESIAPKIGARGANLLFETASEYYTKKARVYLAALDLGLKPFQVTTKDYTWNEDWYIEARWWENALYLEEKFKYDNKEEEERYSSKEAYIYNDPRTRNIDTKLWSELHNMCLAIIHSRKAMLFGKVEQCLPYLYSIVEYTNGFSENGTAAMQADMQNYMQYFKELIEDKEFCEFIKSHNDISVFGIDADYVETYRRLLKAMVNGSEMEMQDLKDWMSETSTVDLSEIFEIRDEPEIESYDDNMSYDEDEEFPIDK